MKDIEKYITFSVPIENEVTSIDKSGKEITKTISYRSQIIDSARFMASSLSDLVNNFVEGIYKIKCKYRHDDRKCETCVSKYKDRDCFLEYTKFKDDLIEMLILQ